MGWVMAGWVCGVEDFSAGAENDPEISDLRSSKLRAQLQSGPSQHLFYLLRISLYSQSIGNALFQGNNKDFVIYKFCLTIKKIQCLQRIFYALNRPREDDHQRPLTTYPLYIFLRILYF